jgi:hypothetical protein
MDSSERVAQRWHSFEEILRLGAFLEERLGLPPDYLDELDKRIRAYVTDTSDEVARVRAQAALRDFISQADEALDERIEA